MYVIHLIARLNDGGPARVIARLATALAAAGGRCEVWTGSPPAHEPDYADQLRTVGIDVRVIPGLGPGAGAGALIAALPAIARRLRRERPDLVHTHTAKAGVIGRVLARWCGFPCLHSYHGHVLHGYFRPRVNRLLRLAERLTAAGAHLHSLTPSLIAELAGGHRIGRPQRWHCLPVPCAPVDPVVAEWARPLREDGRPVIGFLGRCEPVKDLPLFLAVIERLHAHHRIQGLVCGEGRQRAACQRIAQRRGLPVTFSGQVPTAEALGAMDLLLMTSRNEGLPLAALEAAAAGLPVVAPAVGGLRDLAAAGVVEALPRHSEALAAAVATRLAERPEPETRRAARRAAAAGFAPSVVVPAYLALYSSLGGRRATSRQA